MTYQAVINILHRYSKKNSPIDADQQLITLGIDSLSIVDLMLDIESEFGISFEDDDINENTFKTVQSLVGTVDKLVGAR